jgi:SAM-dependent methyltransferase
MNLDWPPKDEPLPGEEYAAYAGVYDLLFEHLDNDVDFYLNAARAHSPLPGAILELGAGTGRLTRRLLAAGHDVLGVDPSGPMLEHARRRLAPFTGRVQLVQASAQSMHFEQRFQLVVAPYGMVAHLHADGERLAVFRNVYVHLKPGGVFLFDDMPGWLAGASDGAKLDLYRTAHDAASGMAVRLMTNMIDVAGQPLSVRYDFIDWLNAQNQVARRVIVRVRFRNIALEDELSLLKQAGFGAIDLLGGFDGRPFCRDDLSRNTRLILRCHRH